jgi:hypothetical protein
MKNAFTKIASGKGKNVFVVNDFVIVAYGVSTSSIPREGELPDHILCSHPNSPPNVILLSGMMIHAKIPFDGISIPNSMLVKEMKMKKTAENAHEKSNEMKQANSLKPCNERCLISFWNEEAVFQ